MTTQSLVSFASIENDSTGSERQQERPALTLQVGQKYPLDGVDALQITVHPPELASVKKTSEGLLLVGASPGTGSLSIVTSQGKIEAGLTVRPPDRHAQSGSPADSPDALVTELRKIPGVKVQRFQNKILVQGEVLGRQDYQKILTLLHLYPKDLVVLARAAPGIKASLIEQASSALRKEGFENIEIDSAGHRFFLEGAVSRPNQVDQVLQTVQNVLPNVESHIPIPLQADPTISVRVFMLELSRRAHDALGLSWPASSRGALIANIGSPGGGNFQMGASFAATLQHLSAQGQAKVLAEPMLAVKVGSSAELNAGGEIPIRITGNFENKVIWKTYGLKLHVDIPMILQSSRGALIRTKINSESSQLDHATAVEGVPGIRRNQMHTEVDVPEGQPLLLTGMFQQGLSKDVEKFPILGSIPLLGELFKARTQRESESELLIALLPTIGATTTKVPLKSTRGLEFDRKWSLLD